MPLEARLNESTTIPIRISYPVPRAVSVAYDIVGADYRKSGTAQFAPEQTEVLIPNATQRHKITTITLHSQSAGRIYDEAGNTLADNVEYDLRLEHGRLQLAGGANARNGRLEVFYNGSWGTVCDDRLDNPGNIAPQKACQFMGYATGELIPRGTVSLAPGSKPIWLDDVRCFAKPQHNRNGTTPTKLHHCYHAGWGNNNCSHEEDVHLSCSGSSEQIEAPALTATLEDVPRNHDGSSAFTLRIAFSADVDITAQHMRDHALTIGNAVVTHATRVDGRSDLWELTVEPAGTGAISILVPLNRPCNETGALCTADGRMLSVAPAHQILGPTQGTQPPGALTASYVSVPAEHDGETDFWLELRFNAALEQGSKTALRALLGATGGSVTKLRRKDGQLDHWRIRIVPSSHETVTVTLSPSPACGTSGSVCTEDGRTFTTALATQIEGPPGLTVGDAEVDEGPNASLAFAVTLSRAASSTVTVDYASANGTATAGSDYTATSGTLTFAVGETRKTVSVQVLDDAIDDDGETLTLTLSNLNGAWLADATGIGTIHNSDPMPKAWITRFGRTVASQVVEAISQRIDGATHAHVTVGGVNLTPPQRFDPNGREPTQWRENPASEGELRTLTGQELLAGSSFHISNGEQSAENPDLSAWGRIATGGFEAEVDDVGMDARVRTGFIAVDAQWDRMLAGVDLDSGYLFGLSLSATRDGDAWAQLLREGQAQGLGLSVVVKDAAKGIAAGVSKVFPRAEQRDDCFHVLYEMNKVRRRMERRAYAAIDREGEALGRLGKIRAYDKERRRKAKRELSSARRGCAEAIERFDAFEAALDTLRGALECVDLATGELHRPEHVEALIEQVAGRIESLGVGKCTKLAKYLRNRAPGLALAQKSVLPRLEALAEPWSAQAVSLACICWSLVRALHKRPARARYRALYRHLLAVYGALQDRLGAASASLLDAVEAVLHQRHRASSAIEGFNAALRPYLYVHKGATQGFLDLFRAWFNLRTRRWGRHKGTSAHQCLTGQRVHDWLTLLGCPPSPTLH